MKNKRLKWISKIDLCLVFMTFTFFCVAQNQNTVAKSNFWNKVQFGGGFGLNIGSGFTDLTLSPSAIYNVNQYFSTGVGLQLSYISTRNIFNSTIYGVNLIQLFNPVEVIQLSVELEQVRVNNVFVNNSALTTEQNFWNTALFVGAGFRQENLTVGVRYNVLYNKKDNVYNEAFMPFVRIFF